MTQDQKLISVKVVHTLIWVFFNLVLIYMYFAVLTNNVDYKFWIGVGLIGVECIVLLTNNWSCPLTFVAREFSDSERDNFDIYLPEWLARHNKLIYTIIFVFLMILYLVRR